MSKIRKYLILVLCLSMIGGIVSATDLPPDDNPFYYGNDNKGDNISSNNKTELGKVIKTDSVNSKDTTLLYKIRQYFRLTGTDTYNSDKPAQAYIQMIINLLLGLVSFISLILVIYAFYFILFDKGEEGVKKAKKILIGVAIALVLMGLAWIIVTSFFNFYTTTVVQNV